MAFFHGVRASEVPTSIVAPVQTTAGLPVVFGTAPVHLTEDPMAYVNKPVICYSYAEAVAALGYSADWENYSLCEVIYSQFKLYAVAPIIFVNVLDPSKHKKNVSDTTGRAVTDGVLVVTDDVMLASLKVKTAEAATPAVLDTDYTAEFDDDGQTVITIIEGGALDGATELYLEYTAIDASLVDSEDIIGGVDRDGNNTGMELLNEIYPRFAMVPGIVAAPGWSQLPGVAAVMKAKALAINNLFRCIVLTDVDTEAVTKYTDVNAWKNKNSYTGVNQLVLWPMVQLGDYIFHYSTQMLGIIGKTDANNQDVPYQSPSNISMQATGMCLKDGTEVFLGLEQANLLNSQGVITGLNFIGGWKSWGNYTGAYPGMTDVKDTFICVRRMFDWQYQTFILTYWQKVDQPLMPRLVRTILDSEQIRLNGLVSRGYLLGASVDFLEDENPLTDLLNGILRIHTKLTPPVPAQTIEDILEYDVNNFEALFNA